MNTSHQTTAPAASVESPHLVYVRGLGDRGNVITTGLDGKVGLAIQRGSDDLSVVMDPDEAAGVLHNLRTAVASVTPANPEVLGTVEDVARERGITLAELATVAGVDLESASGADLTKLAMTLAYCEQRLPEHLLRVMETA